MTQCFIGTSGWQYSNWRGSFYPQDLPSSQWLSFYAQHFDTVEVNSSFYRQTRASTFKKWQEETPRDFVFSVKGNRFITHIKRLKDVEGPLKVFFDNVSILPGSPHVILWQLPPSLKKDIQKLETFVKLLPKAFRHAFEFRHATWVSQDSWEVLKKHNIAVVFQDWQTWPQIEEETSNFIYIRHHGREILYTSNYSDNELAIWAKKNRAWLKKGKDVYVYFNNDAHGYAVHNASRLKELVSGT